MDDEDMKDFFQDDGPECPNNLFALFRYSLDGIQGIRVFEVINDYIFILNEMAEFYKFNINHNKNFIKTPFPIPGVHIKDFNTTINERIWVDKNGNFAIIKIQEKYFFFKDKIYQLTHLNEKYFENKEKYDNYNKDNKDNEKKIDFIEFSFDRRNNNSYTTQEILVADNNFNLYSYRIDITNQGIKEYITFLIKLPQSKQSKVTSNKIFGIQFFANSKLEKNNINYYVMVVTKNKLYQFTGINSLVDVFKEYNTSKKLQESTIIFPSIGKNFLFSKLQFTYDENNNFNPQSFGWLTESGFCYSNFNGNEVPDKLNNFTILPYIKIKKDGNREIDAIPKSFSHSKNHIFILYTDCISIISKITNNIIDSQYTTNDDFLNIYYDEKNYIWVLNKINNIYQISINARNKYLWQDYLEIGDFRNAIEICKKEKPDLVYKIEKLYAEENFNNKNYTIAASTYATSDEKFEDVCLKFLQKNELEGLSNYLNSVLEFRLNKKENLEENNKLILDEKKRKELEILETKENMQKCLISTWIIEIYLNQTKNETKKDLNSFKQLIRGREKYLDKETIYQLLQNYGRIDEFILFADMKEDYETIILHYINEKNIKKALEKITTYCLYIEEEQKIDNLAKIFEKFIFLIMKEYPKETIDLLKNKFKNRISPEKIINAIMNTTNIEEGNENFKEILNYLRDLVKNDTDNKNIHNLYLYFLSKCKSSSEKLELINYLKKPLSKEPESIYNKNSKKINFEPDYAKKLFKDNYSALALVTALMGKYSEGVKIALNNNENSIAMFIAENVQDNTIKKNLWLEIFSSNKNENFKNALEIMNKSNKVLKIEDVLPRIMDNIKIDEFKDQISTCINYYEKNIRELRDDINQYNQTAENIKNDIYKVKKKSIEIQYRQCKCDICQCNIKDNNIFLFPCGHMFDTKCIINSLENFKKYMNNNKKQNESKNNNNKKKQNESKNNNNKIKQNFDSIDLKLKEINEIYKEINEIENKTKIQVEKEKLNLFGTLMNVMRKQNTKSEIQELSKEDEKKLKNLKQKVNDILSEECVLCGDYMIESTQTLFVEEDNINWSLK